MYVIVLCLLFTPERLPLKAIIYIIINYIQKVNVRIYYLYTSNFPTAAYSIKWNNIYWDHFTPHIVYWRGRNQATS